MTVEQQVAIHEALAENIARIQFLVMQALSDGQADQEVLPSIEELCVDIDQAITENIAQCAACLQEIPSASLDELDEIFDDLYSYLEEFIALKLLLQSMPLDLPIQKLAMLLLGLVEIPLFNIMLFLQDVALRFHDAYARDEAIRWSEPEYYFDFDRLEMQAALIKKEFSHLLDDSLFRFVVTEPQA